MRLFRYLSESLLQFGAILASSDFRDRLQTLNTLLETRNFSIPDIPLVVFYVFAVAR